MIKPAPILTEVPGIREEQRRLVGYWRELEDSNEPLPWPGDHCDSGMSSKEREEIAQRLDAAPVLARSRGLSHDRLGRGIVRGSACLGNDQFRWPQGLSHYVRTYGLRLPPELLESLGIPQNLQIFSVTIFPNPFEYPDLVISAEISARTPQQAVRQLWVDEELGYSVAKVTGPGIEDHLRFVIEPVAAAKIIDVTKPSPVRPLSEEAQAVTPGCLVCAPLSASLAHLDSQPREYIHVFADRCGYPSESRGFLSGQGLPAKVLAVHDYVRNYEEEGPSSWGLGSVVYRNVEIEETGTGLRGWVNAERLEILKR